MITGAVVIGVVLAATGVVRHFTSASYIEGHLRRAVGPRYHVTIGSSHYDLLDRTFVARNFSVWPDTVYTQGKSRLRKWYAADVSSLHITGVSLWSIWRGRFFADTVTIDGLRGEISFDRTISRSGPLKRVRQPHEWLTGLNARVNIGMIRVRDGHIRYAERAYNGTRPGTFVFGKLNATIDNVSNQDASKPCVIDVTSRLADEAPITARFEYDLNAPTMHLDYRARVGGMAATSLNELLVNLAGVRVTEGNIDSLYVDVKAREDVATGTLLVLYHDLGFELLDKNSHDQSLEDKVRSFMSKKKARDSNPEDPDEQPLVITLRRPREPEFFVARYVWQTVREGLLMTLGVI